jgi:signal peptidase I
MTINFDSPTWIFLRELSTTIDNFALYMQKKGPQFHEFAKKRKMAITGNYTEEKKGFNISPEKLGTNLPLAVIIVYLGLVGVFTIAFYTENYTGMRLTSITTGSMAPEIEPGSAIFSQKQRTYKVGDIITYRDANPTTGNLLPSTTTHRIVSLRETSRGPAYITQGDANIVPDAVIVSQEQVLGKVTYRVRFLGYFLSYMRTLPGFLALVVFPAGILIFNEINYIRKQLKEDKVVRKISKEVLEF